MPLVLEIDFFSFFLSLEVFTASGDSPWETTFCFKGFSESSSVKFQDFHTCTVLHMYNYTHKYINNGNFKTEKSCSHNSFLDRVYFTELQISKSLLWRSLPPYLQDPCLKSQPIAIKNNLKNPYKVEVVAHTYNPSIQESETTGLTQVQYQPGLHSSRSASTA